MESTKLDIWAIQKDPSELDVALDKLVKPAINVLYTNCISKLKLGGILLGIEFDTALYSEENDILILIMRGAKVTREELINKLEEREIEFAQVKFSSDTFADYDEEIKEICFARDGSVLKDALRDSKNKGNYVCRYNPVIKGKLSLKYPGRYYFGDECEEVQNTITLERLSIRGMIETADKMVLLINDHDDCNVYYKQVLRILSETGMIPIIEDFDTFKQREKAKEKVKTKEDE